MSDPVNPEHYTHGAIECIDGLESALGEIGFQDFLRGNVVKYLWRLRLKGLALEDARKAQWYLNKLVASISKADGLNQFVADFVKNEDPLPFPKMKWVSVKAIDKNGNEYMRSTQVPVED
jgi:Protein of unknwon function (DUF3310)